jgi:predicted nuclease of restriction endonuclease-like (RecB) superfamily
VTQGNLQTSTVQSPDLSALAKAFPLPWSAYVRLLSVKNPHARAFYETETLRCGWSVRQLDRQVNSQFYERIALSRNKAAMLQKAEDAEPGDIITPEQAIKDPFVLEFLNLKDEYSESELEQALIEHLADFLLELGDDFAFVGRQRQLRLDDTWFRIDLLFFHRRLKCLLIIDLKAGKFNHADAGQMHLYLNYAREHWTKPGENPPVGLILCAEKGASQAHYALEGLPNKVLAAEYQTALPNEKLLTEEIEKTRRELETRRMGRKGDVGGGA